MFSRRFWTNLDWQLLGATALLVALGLLVIYSTSFKAVGLSAPVESVHQAIFALVGGALLLVIAATDYRLWGKFTTWLYLAAVGSLVVVMILGKTALGATRWINLGFFQFQPSELVKLVLIIVLAKFFSDHYDELDRPRFLVISGIYVLVPLVLVLVQPDLGTAMVLAVIWLAMALASPVRKSAIALVGLLGLGLVPVVYHFLKPYQQARLLAFLHPAADPLHTGYNVVQSTIAVGSGQLLGQGLAAGSQSQLNFLPSQHTDFIFAVLSEKLGFVGATLMLGLFALLLLRGLIVAYRARDRFGFFLGVGIVAMLLFHLFINVGMNMGLVPVTGIPLPFVSYGGTSLIIGLMAVGLLTSIAVRRRVIQFGT